MQKRKMQETTLNSGPELYAWLSCLCQAKFLMLVRFTGILLTCRCMSHFSVGRGGIARGRWGVIYGSGGPQ